MACPVCLEAVKGPAYTLGCCTDARFHRHCFTIMVMKMGDACPLCRRRFEIVRDQHARPVIRVRPTDVCSHKHVSPRTMEVLLQAFQRAADNATETRKGACERLCDWLFA